MLGIWEGVRDLWSSIDGLCSWLRMTHRDSGEFISPLVSPSVKLVSHRLSPRKTLWGAGEFDLPGYSVQTALNEAQNGGSGNTRGA